MRLKNSARRILRCCRTIASARIPLALAVVVVATAESQAQADPAPSEFTERTTYGDVGIIELPTAQMAPDGQLSFNVGGMHDVERYSLAMQMLPWLEGSFRYSLIRNYAKNGGDYFDRSLGAKIRLSREGEYVPSIAIGARDILGTGLYSAEYVVFTKKIYTADVSVGMGWGRLSDNAAFDNPLASIFPSFKNRQSINNLTGTADFSQLFHGPKVGIFGGVIWHTPIENLDLLGEFSTDEYVLEDTKGKFVHSPFNVGLSYHPIDGVAITAGYMYGSSYGFVLSLLTDPTEPIQPIRIGATVPTPSIRNNAQQVRALNGLVNPYRPGQPWIRGPQSEAGEIATLRAALMSASAGVRDVDIEGHTLMVNASSTRPAQSECMVYAQIARATGTSLTALAVSDLQNSNSPVAVCSITRRNAQDLGEAVSDATMGAQNTPIDAGSIFSASRQIRAEIAAQSLRVDAMSIEGSSIWLYYENDHYFWEDEAIRRIVRVLMKDAPSDVEVFHLIAIKQGKPTRELNISRSALERSAATTGTSHEQGPAFDIALAPLDNPVLDQGWEGTFPRFSWSISPGLREGLFTPSQPLEVQILAGLDASLQVIPELTFNARVEANIYNNFDLNAPNTSLLPHVRSDILEYYRHGINGIARLDASYDKRLSQDLFFRAKAGYLESMFAGGGVQLLWRPDGDRLAFGADLYEVYQRDFNRLFGVQDYHILTGHLSVYYASPWYGLDFNVHGGRYLAGDYGATFEIVRRFSTGVEIGAFATFTNVSAARFGEGSFDKGLIVRIPFEWGLPFYSQSSYNLVLRSLTRDGGQRLDRDDDLYEDTRSTSYEDISSHLDDITQP